MRARLTSILLKARRSGMRTGRMAAAAAATAPLSVELTESTGKMVGIVEVGEVQMVGE